MNNETSELAENKVLILYVLNKINEEINESDLFRIISSVNNVNYFYFKQILNDVINSMLVEEKNNQLIAISKLGLESLSLTENILPGIIKLKVDNILKGELTSIEEESSVVAEFTPKGENGYTVTCKIVENNETVFEINTYAGSQEKANAIVENWKHNANTIYPSILNLL